MGQKQLDEVERLNNEQDEVYTVSEETLINTVSDENLECIDKLINERTHLEYDFGCLDKITNKLFINGDVRQYDKEVDESFGGLFDKSFVNYLVDDINGVPNSNINRNYFAVMQLLKFARSDYEDWNQFNDSMHMLQRNDLPFDPGPRNGTVCG